MIPSQHLFTIQLFSSFKPVLKKHFIFICSDEITKNFCNCVFNIKRGSIELQNVKIKSLKTNMTLIEKLFSSKIRLVLKRRLLASKQGLSLLRLLNNSIQFEPETAMRWAAKQQRDLFLFPLTSILQKHDASWLDYIPHRCWIHHNQKRD